MGRIMGSGYGKVVFIGGGMHASSHALTDRHSNISRVFGTLGFAVWVSSLLDQRALTS